jgi:hypothetical protein
MDAVGTRQYKWRQARVITGEGVEQRRAQRVDVAVRPGLALAMLLRRGVAGRAQRLGIRRLVLLERPGDPKVNQFNAVAGCEDDVAGREVAVDDRRVLAVQVAQHVAELIGQVQHLRFGQAIPLADHPLGQRLTLHVFSDQHGPAFVAHKVINDLDNAGVVELGEHACGGLELLERGLGGLCAKLEDFDDYLAIECARVGSQIDGGLSPIGQPADDLITLVQDRPWGQHGAQSAVVLGSRRGGSLHWWAPARRRGRLCNLDGARAGLARPSASGAGQHQPDAATQ